MLDRTPFKKSAIQLRDASKHIGEERYWKWHLHHGACPNVNERTVESKTAENV